MPSQSRLGDKALITADSHGCPACPHTASGPAVSGSANVLVNGRPAIRVGDQGIHAACCGAGTWQALSGSQTVLINNRATHRFGDAVKHCGGIGKTIEGSANVIIGDGVQLGGSKDDTSNIKIIPVVAFFIPARPNGQLDGSFGFDWLTYEPSKRSYVAQQGATISDLRTFFDPVQGSFVVLGSEEVKQEKIVTDYQKLPDIQEIDYRIPYLSIQVNQEVSLKLDISMLPSYDEKADVTWEPNDLIIATEDAASYEVTVNESKLKGIKSAKKVEVKIKCKKTAIASSITVKDKNSQIVGRLNIVDNSSIQEIHLRTVSLIPRDSDSKTVEVKEKEIEAFLNKKSLNQANIKCILERFNDPSKQYYLEYDYTDPVWADYLASEGGALKFRNKGQNPDETLLLTFLVKVYNEKYTMQEKSNPFKGILLFVTNAEKLLIYESGGETMTVPVDFNAIIIFGHKLGNFTAYAHETGHILGLEHVFEDTKTEPGFLMRRNNNKDNREITRMRIAKIKAEHYREGSPGNSEDVEKLRQLEAEWNAAFDKKEAPSTSVTEKAALEKKMSVIRHEEMPLIQAKFVKDEQLTDDEKRKLAELAAQLEVEEEIEFLCISNKYRFKQDSTYNIMDYSISHTKEKSIFTHLQWTIMQRNIRFSQ